MSYDFLCLLLTAERSKKSQKILVKWHLNPDSVVKQLNGFKGLSRFSVDLEPAQPLVAKTTSCLDLWKTISLSLHEYRLMQGMRVLDFFFNFMDLHCNVGNVNREESDSSTRPPSSGFHIANPCETSLTQWRMSWNGWKMGVLIRRPFAFCITAVLLTVRLKLPFLCSDSVTPFAVSHPAGRDLITATSGFSDVVHITFARGLWGWRFGPLPFWNLRSRGTCNDPGLRTLLHCDWNGWRTWRTQWIPIRTRVASLQLQGWREDSSDGADV